MQESPGKKFRQSLQEEKPLQILGVINAYVALMAKEVGFKALYLSGAGVANSSFGVPDLGLTSLDNLLEDARRITTIVDLPLLVDIDTGWGNPIKIARAVKSLQLAGVAGIQIEDQAKEKKCGHLPRKRLVSKDVMAERIRAAVEAKIDPNFIVMARCDAYDEEGLDRVIERCRAYEIAGADMFFPEALPTLEDYRAFREGISLPFLANLTEFGKTPLLSTRKLQSAGVDMALYPLSVNRAMNQAALKIMKEIREKGTQLGCIELMQTREELYHFLEYHKYEEALNEEHKLE